MSRKRSQSVGDSLDKPKPPFKRESEIIEQRVKRAKIPLPQQQEGDRAARYGRTIARQRHRLELNQRSEESGPKGGKADSPQGSIPKLKATRLVRIPSIIERNRKFFESLVDKLHIEKTSIQIDFTQAGIELIKLESSIVKNFYHEVIHRNYNIIGLDRASEQAIIDILNIKIQRPRTESLKISAEEKIKEEFFERILQRVKDNKAQAIESCKYLKTVFDSDKDKKFQLDDDNVLNNCLLQLAAVLKILEKGSRDFQGNPMLLREFKSFAKTAFTQNELSELQSVGKSEFEIVEAGIQKRIEMIKNPQPIVATPRASPASSQESQNTQAA